MSKNLAAIAKQKKIKYFLISFVDLFGVLRAKLVPARAIAGMQRDGAGFAGFAAWLDMTPADPDMFGIPDPDSLTILPWKPEVAWLASDLWMGGKEVEADGKTVALNSKETIESIKFAVALWKETMDEGGLAWDDTNNNRAFLSGTVSATTMQ